MADGFWVDLGALESAAEGINAILYNLHSKKVNKIDGKSADYGHEHLGETVSDFCDRWGARGGESGERRVGSRQPAVPECAGLSAGRQCPQGAHGRYPAAFQWR